MSIRGLYAAVAVAAVAAGTLLWWLGRPSPPSDALRVEVAPAVLFAATFTDTHGARRSLGEFQGRTIVVNFWATWCTPCREEMPGFARLQSAWKDRGVQFVGLADDEAGKVQRFGEELHINYPLWVGREEVGELSRRLGNLGGGLPHTVIVDAGGRVVQAKVGAYSEPQLEAELRRFVGRS